MQGLFGDAKIEKIETEIDLKKYKEIKQEEQKIHENYTIKDVFGYEKIFFHFENLFQKKRLYHANIISGEIGIGKATFCYNLIAKLILNNNNNDNEIKDLLIKNSHLDIFILKQNKDGIISVDDVRKIFDFIYLKSISGQKFIIIDDINSMNINGMNALLKILEEPTKNTFFFLINHNLGEILSTIFSRCQKIKMPNLLLEDFSKIFIEKNAEKYYNFSNGSIKIAQILHKLNIFDQISNFEKNQKKDEIFKKIFLMQLYNKIENSIKNSNLSLQILQYIIYQLFKDDSILLDEINKSIVKIKKYKVNFII